MGMPHEAPMDEYRKMTGEPCTCNGTPLREIGEQINKAVAKQKYEQKNKLTLRQKLRKWWRK